MKIIHDCGLIFLFSIVVSTFIQLGVALEVSGLGEIVPTPTLAQVAPSESSRSYAISSPTTEPLVIHKRIMEPEKNGYFVGEPIWIFVEIKCINARDLTDIHAWEQTDSGLEIINYSCSIRSSEINITYHPERLFTWNCRPYRDNNIIYNHLGEMYAPESLIYMYCIKPMRPGVLNTYTVVRIYKVNNDILEYYTPLQIDVNEIIPQFQFLVDVNKAEAECYEEIPIKYSIKYLGGAPTNPCNYVASLDKSSDYSIDRTEFNETFYKSNFSLLYANIKFYNPGIYSIPGISIGGQYYAPAQYITIRIL
jgi:hypothetical protein